MKFEVKLPKSYYQYADIDLEKLKNVDQHENITINLSSFLSCKLEQIALQKAKPVQEILKLILIEEGVLDEKDVEFSGRSKSSSKFFNVDCEELRDIGTSKLYRIKLSIFAKAKVLKKMVELGFDLSFFIKKSMVKKSEKGKFYQVLKPSDIGM